MDKNVNFQTVGHMMRTEMEARSRGLIAGTTNWAAFICKRFAELSATGDPMADWRKPTTYLQRFGDSIALLCAGVRPAEEMLTDWLDPRKDSIALQDFASEHGPAWAQGIGVIDAARVLADQPTEGVDHEMTPPTFAESIATVGGQHD